MARRFSSAGSRVPVAKSQLDLIAESPVQILLIADAPDGAVETLRANGVRTGVTLDVETSFAREQP